jgi:hypothetical protein
MAHVWIPPLMRDLTGGREILIAGGGRVREVIEDLDRQFPGIRARLCDGDALRSGLAVAVDTGIARLGLREPVGPDSEVHFLLAIGGGAPLMTRQQWLAHSDPLLLLDSLGSANDRRLWLFVCACCRMIPEIAINDQACVALDWAEACAAGRFDRGQLEARWQRGLPPTGDPEADAALQVALFSTGPSGQTMALAAFRLATVARRRAAEFAGRHPARRAERRAVGRWRRILRQQQGELLRCILPNPYGPIAVEPVQSVRRDHRVLAMVRAIYDERLFADVPILADALEDAGYHDPEVLAHSRGPGPHARGCWVLELLLLDKPPTNRPRGNP